LTIRLTKKPRGSGLENPQTQNTKVFIVVREAERER